MASVPTLEEMLRSLDAPPAVDPLVEKILRSLLAVVVERSVVETNVKLIESMEQYQTRRWDNVLRGEEELWRRRRKDRLAKAAVAAQRRREEQDRHQLKMVQAQHTRGTRIPVPQAATRSPRRSPPPLRVVEPPASSTSSSSATRTVFFSLVGNTGKPPPPSPSSSVPPHGGALCRGATRSPRSLSPRLVAHRRVEGVLQGGVGGRATVAPQKQQRQKQAPPTRSTQQFIVSDRGDEEAEAEYSEGGGREDGGSEDGGSEGGDARTVLVGESGESGEGSEGGGRHGTATAVVLVPAADTGIPTVQPATPATLATLATLATPATPAPPATPATLAAMPAMPAASNTAAVNEWVATMTAGAAAAAACASSVREGLYPPSKPCSKRPVRRRSLREVWAKQHSAVLKTDTTWAAKEKEGGDVHLNVEQRGGTEHVQLAHLELGGGKVGDIDTRGAEDNLPAGVVFPSCTTTDGSDDIDGANGGGACTTPAVVRPGRGGKKPHISPPPLNTSFNEHVPLDNLLLGAPGVMSAISHKPDDPPHVTRSPNHFARHVMSVSAPTSPRVSAAMAAAATPPSSQQPGSPLSLSLVHRGDEVSTITVHRGLVSDMSLWCGSTWNANDGKCLAGSSSSKQTAPTTSTQPAAPTAPTERYGSLKRFSERYYGSSRGGGSPSGKNVSGSGNINVRPPAQGAWRAVVASSSSALLPQQQGSDGNISISSPATSSPASLSLPASSIQRSPNERRASSPPLSPRSTLAALQMRGQQTIGGGGDRVNGGGSDGSNGGSGAIEHAHEADGAAATTCMQEQTARGRAKELAGKPQASLSQPRPVTTQTTPSPDPNHHASATSTTSLSSQKLPATTTTKLTKLARHEKKAALARKRKSKASSVEPVQAGGLAGEGGGDAAAAAAAAAVDNVRVNRIIAKKMDQLKAYEVITTKRENNRASGSRAKRERQLDRAKGRAIHLEKSKFLERTSQKHGSRKSAFGIGGIDRVGGGKVLVSSIARSNDGVHAPTNVSPRSVRLRSVLSARLARRASQNGGQPIGMGAGESSTGEDGSATAGKKSTIANKKVTAAVKPGTKKSGGRKSSFMRHVLTKTFMPS